MDCSVKIGKNRKECPFKSSMNLKPIIFIVPLLGKKPIVLFYIILF